MFTVTLTRSISTSPIVSEIHFAARGSLVCKKILVAGGQNAQHQPVLQIATFNPARIWTDKDDYQPDDQVILSGSGWKPNENVYLYAVDNETEAWTYESTIAADANRAAAG